MAKEVANIAYTFLITPLSGTSTQHVNGIPIVDPNEKVGDLAVIVTSLPFVASGCTFPPNTHISGSGVIMPTSICKWGNQQVLRKGDWGICSGTFQPPSGSPIPCSCRVEIIDAGQSGVLCD